MAFSLVSAQAATFSTIRPEKMGRASSLFSTTRQVAAAVGVAVLATVLISQTGPGTTQPVSLGAFHTAFLAGAIFGLIGAGRALLIHDEDAAASLRRRPARPKASSPKVAVS